MKYDILNSGEGTLVRLCEKTKSVMVESLKKKSKFTFDLQKPKR